MLPADEEIKIALAGFARFAAGFAGDEKSEAQSYLEHLFRALGHKGVIEAGATFEFRIAKKPGSAQLELLTGPDAPRAKGGKKFADLLWPARVLALPRQRARARLRAAALRALHAHMHRRVAAPDLRGEGGRVRDSG